MIREKKTSQLHEWRSFYQYLLRPKISNAKQQQQQQQQQAAKAVGLCMGWASHQSDLCLPLGVEYFGSVSGGSLHAHDSHTFPRLLLLGKFTRGRRRVERGGEGGGGAYSFVACLSNLTIDHASLSRRSTVPTPNRDTSNIWALITRLPYTTSKNCLLILSPSCFTVCDHLSPGIAMVCSLLSSLPNSSMSHTYNFLISSSNASRSSLHVSRSSRGERGGVITNIGVGVLIPRMTVIVQP